MHDFIIQLITSAVGFFVAYQIFALLIFDFTDSSIDSSVINLFISSFLITYILDLYLGTLIGDLIASFLFIFLAKRFLRITTKLAWRFTFVWSGITFISALLMGRLSI